MDLEIDHYGHLGEMRSVLEQREKTALRLLQGHLKQRPVHALDLGCGDGCFLSAAAETFPGIGLAGLDLSPNQIDKARRRLPGADLRLGSLSNPLAFDSEKFDFVFSGEVIEHLMNPDLFLREIFRVLKPGGLLVMTTPNLMAWYNRILILIGISPLFVEYSTENSSVGYGPLRRLKNSDQPVGHLRIFHPAALRGIQEIHGFKIASIKSAKFEFFPAPVRALDGLVSALWVRGASVLISLARKPGPA